jgi:hypothetical protein
MGEAGGIVDAQRILGLAQQHHEADHGGAEPQGQGQEQRDQQGQDDGFQARDAAQGDGVVGGPPAGEGHDRGGDEHAPATQDEAFPDRVLGAVAAGLASPCQKASGWTGMARGASTGISTRSCAEITVS